MRYFRVGKDGRIANTYKTNKTSRFQFKYKTPVPASNVKMVPGRAKIEDQNESGVLGDVSIR